MACCLLLRAGLAKTADEAMDYYAIKRVKPGKKGLTVPTQMRCGDGGWNPPRGVQRCCVLGVAGLGRELASPTALIASEMHL